MFIIYRATHPDGSHYYGLTAKGLRYAKEQHRMSSYMSGGHTSVTGMAIYANKTGVSPMNWEYDIMFYAKLKDEALKLKRYCVACDPNCLNIKYKVVRKNDL